MLKTIIGGGAVIGVAWLSAVASTHSDRYTATAATTQASQKPEPSRLVDDKTNLSNVHDQDLKNLRLHILSSRYECKTTKGAWAWRSEFRWTVQCDKYAYDVYDRGGRYVVIPQSRRY
jgi:hypothetical protein